MCVAADVAKGNCLKVVDIMKCGREEGRAGQPCSVSFSGMLLPVNLSFVEHKYICVRVYVRAFK